MFLWKLKLNQYLYYNVVCIYTLLLSPLDTIFFFMYVNNVGISYVYIFLFWKYVNHKKKTHNKVVLTVQQDSSISNINLFAIIQKLYHGWAVVHNVLLAPSETNNIKFWQVINYYMCFNFPLNCRECEWGGMESGTYLRCNFFPYLQNFHNFYILQL